MSKKEQKIIRIKENELVEMLDTILAEAVEAKKQEWLSEHEAKNAAVLEERIKSLEQKLATLTESKK